MPALSLDINVVMAIPAIEVSLFPIRAKMLARCGSNCNYYRQGKEDADYGFDSTQHIGRGCCGSASRHAAHNLLSRLRQGGKFYERGPVRIYYEEAGSGFPLLLPAAD